MFDSNDIGDLRNLITEQAALVTKLSRNVEQERRSKDIIVEALMGRDKKIDAMQLERDSLTEKCTALESRISELEAEISAKKEGVMA